jgi:hypothetical protein
MLPKHVVVKMDLESEYNFPWLKDSSRRSFVLDVEPGME